MKGLNSRGARGPTSTLSSFNPLIKIRALGILWRIINRCSFNRMIYFFPFIIYHLHGKACPAFSNIILCVRLHCICATDVIFDKQAETHVCYIPFPWLFCTEGGFIWSLSFLLSCPSSVKDQKLTVGIFESLLQVASCAFSLELCFQ